MMMNDALMMMMVIETQKNQNRATKYNPRKWQPHAENTRDASNRNKEKKKKQGKPPAQKERQMENSREYKEIEPEAHVVSLPDVT